MFQILIVTLKRAFPNVLRFLVCAAVFYLGFTFCGWVVLGPYHLKVNCFYSLLNVCVMVFESHHKYLCLIAAFQLMNNEFGASGTVIMKLMVKCSVLCRICPIAKLQIKVSVVIVLLDLQFTSSLSTFVNMRKFWFVCFQFRTLSSTSECLFALVNGDELYMTFSALTNANVYMWWYSRVYLYVFISLFIYVVLSVFISVIMDTYETTKVGVQLLPNII